MDDRRSTGPADGNTAAAAAEPSYFRPSVAASAREAVPLDPRRTALLLVDVQRYNLSTHGAVWGPVAYASAAIETTAAERASAAALVAHLKRVASALPRMQQLLSAARLAGAEPLYTVIESLTRDGRDRGLDYKLSGMHVAKGSDDAKVLDEVAPGPDEIVLPKTSSSPFASTTLEYVLRNLGRDQLLVCGALTDQCISSTVREAADRGLRVTLCPDACVGSSDEAHAAAVSHLKGYARIRTTEEAFKELLASGGGEDEG